MLVQGPVEKKIITQCIRERLPFPEKIKNAPQLHLGLDLYFTAFLDLTTCRPGGMGLYPIPWDRIQDYGERFYFSDELLEEFHILIRKLDEAWVEHFDKKHQSKIGKDKPTLGKKLPPSRIPPRRKKS